MERDIDLWDTRDLYVNGVRLHVRVAGSGPLVLLLHGFPDHGNVWRFVAPALVEAGMRVAVPDLRGYGLSDAPDGLAAYRTDVLAADVAGMIEQLGGGPAAVVGHDWGGVLAWQTA